MIVPNNANAVIHVPDGLEPIAAAERVTHLCVGAHQDDLEIMGIEGILACYEQTDKWFGGVIVNDGASAPRTGRFADFTNADMAAKRIEEQKQAADLGQYAIQVLLGFSNEETKDPENPHPIQDIKEILQATRPEVVYTHNLLDKHYAHVAVTIQTVRAIRELEPDDRPSRVIGCEVWRDLDWLVGADKVVMPTNERPKLQRALLEVFESQLEGKRYDLAAMGRRVAHATYLDPHENDNVQGAVFGMDLTPLILDAALDIRAFALEYVERLHEAVAKQIDEVL